MCSASRASSQGWKKTQLCLCSWKPKAPRCTGLAVLRFKRRERDSVSDWCSFSLQKLISSPPAVSWLQPYTSYTSVHLPMHRYTPPKHTSITDRPHHIELLLLPDDSSLWDYYCNLKELILLHLWVSRHRFSTTTAEVPTSRLWKSSDLFAVHTTWLSVLWSMQQ